MTQQDFEKTVHGRALLEFIYNVPQGITTEALKHTAEVLANELYGSPFSLEKFFKWYIEDEFDSPKRMFLMSQPMYLFIKELHRIEANVWTELDE